MKSRIDPRLLRELIREGADRAEAAREFGVKDLGTVSRAARRAGVRFPMQRPCPYRRARILDLISLGYHNCNRLAPLIRTSRQALRKTLNRLVAEKVLKRTGYGRWTRYEVTPQWSRPEPKETRCGR